jgi:hypothetical protein
MTRKAADAATAKHASPPPKPRDVIDGVPDVSARRPAWKYVLIAAIFLAWVGFLIYCGLAGSP